MRPSVAIIGAGFSGIVTAYELVHQAKFSLDIYLFDPSSYSGKGIAYSTNCPLHLLNVTAERMSALENDPHHFLHWLQKEPGLWRKLDPSFCQLKIERNLYFPRMIYGNYLQHIVDLTNETAEKKEIRIYWIKKNVIDIKSKESGLLEIITDSGVQQAINVAILATGIPWTRPISNPSFLDANAGYLEAPWPILTHMDQASQWLQGTTSTTTIALIGSGLTMLDAAAALYFMGFPGRIEVISRLALLPQAHNHTLTPLKPFSDPNEFPKTALKILKKLHKLSLPARKKHGYDWRAIINAMRPITNSLWTLLPRIEKQRFLRHLFTRWNVYRHRSPQQTLDIFETYKNQKRLKINKALAISIEKIDQKIHITMIDSKTGSHFKKSFDRVINCSGPNFNLNKFSSQLIKNLLQSRLATPDPLGLGLQVDVYTLITAMGRNRKEHNSSHQNIFALGSLLFGTYFETLAVPEIRIQCQKVASQTLERMFN